MPNDELLRASTYTQADTPSSSDCSTTSPEQARAVQEYVTGFGRRFLYKDVLEKYPETRVIPPFLRAHFATAEVVLDLGFGTGIWFWASFLPALQRIDGIEKYPQALAEADRVLHLPAVPEGYLAAHQTLGESFPLEKFRAMQSKRGNLLLGDVLAPWSPLITHSRYDLITEYGGLGAAETETQFFGVIARAASVLKPGGAVLFVNFVEHEIPQVEKKMGGNPAELPQDIPLFARAAHQAGLELPEFYQIDQPAQMENIDRFLYGFARKPA